MIESLETRQLLSFSVDINGGAMNVRSSGDSATVTVVENNGTVEVYGDTVADNYAVYTGITSIAMWGNTGNDTLRYDGTSIGAKVRGNNGADHIFITDGGTASSDVDGESDNDVITIAQAHGTTVSGGSGNDSIFINTANVDHDPAFDLMLDNAECVVIAGSGDDVIRLVDGKATINGGAGTDEVILDAAQDGVVLVKVEIVTPNP
jgi:Ca2+-binding RTX toxin-like protein